ncbi:TPA: hypothetical protein J1070_004548, partial [Escherichia coli]|nr:hypothetical protein [Escherichia coli]
NVLTTFADSSKAISDKFSTNLADGFKDGFEEIDSSTLTKNSLFNISYNTETMTFYGHYSDDGKGFYTLGVLTPNAFLHQLPLSIVYNILGGKGGVVRNGEFISIDESVSRIDLHKLNIPDNSVAYLLYQPIEQYVLSEKLEAVSYSGESINDDTLNVLSCDVVCANSYLTFVWNNIGFTNLRFYILINGENLWLPEVNLDSGMFFLSIKNFLDILKGSNLLKNASISFYLEGESIATKKKQKTFFNPNLSLTFK